MVTILKYQLVIVELVKQPWDRPLMLQEVKGPMKVVRLSALRSARI